MTQLTPVPAHVVVQQIPARAVPKSARTFRNQKVRHGARDTAAGVASNRADFGASSSSLTDTKFATTIRLTRV